MKLETLTVIFLIIIIPITIVLSTYVDNLIKAEQTELTYNTRLLNATHDSIKTYQLRTIKNEYGDVTASKIEDIEGAVSSFYSSISASMGYTGYKSTSMKEFIPALVYTLYDGYYIHSPYTNTLTNLKGGADPEYDTEYSDNNETYYGLKPYVYYSCRYIRGTDDFVITYTLDNYITIQGMINGNYVYDYGYLMTGITKKSDTEYEYDGISFKETETETEQMTEYVVGNLYPYVKINGKKYYLDNNGTPYDVSDDGIFFLDNSGNKNYQQFIKDSDEYKKALNAIKTNKSAFEYYKNAYEFTERVLTSKLASNLSNNKDKMGNTHNKGYGLNNLNTNNATIYGNSASTDLTDISEFGDFRIFEGNVHFADSNFNKHRESIIRYTIETNLLPAIQSFKGNSNDEFIMPKISEADWELIENNVCAISFMQGMNIGTKRYNSYSVVANSLTKEYVDENDIYFSDASKDTYYKINDTIFQTDYDNDKTKGYWKIDFEQKAGLANDGKKIYYCPRKEYGSYSSIYGSYETEEIGIDMYTYVQNLTNNNLKTKYYMALGRERWESFNINNTNYERDKGYNLEYFLKDY